MGYYSRRRAGRLPAARWPDHLVAVFCLLCDSRNVTSCQRCCLESCDHDGMPELSLPVVMNQNSSPALALRTEAVSSAGAGPIPCMLFPWHCAQLCA